MRASGTARAVASALLVAADDPALADLLDRGSVANAVHALSEGPGRALVRALRTRPGRALARGVERLLLPGFVAHVVLRRVIVWHLVERAAADGCTQIIVLGAGLDDLADRASARLGLAAFAVDRHVLSRAASAPERSHRVAADLTADEPLAPVLRHPAFDPTRPTLVVAEGLLMYLPRHFAQRLLRSAAVIPACRSLLATVMSPDKRGAARFQGQHRLIDRWMRKRGEPFRWGVPNHGIASLLEPCGWRPQLVAETRDPSIVGLHAEPRGPTVPPARGEIIVLATRTQQS
ncbi:MAG: class I SAM-dependent methyltransferase [Phycisphaerales bacterium]